MDDDATPWIDGGTGPKIAYSGMVLAYLATASDATAQIVYTDLDDAVVYFSELAIDIDGDGSAEVWVRQTQWASSNFIGMVYLAPQASVLGYEEQGVKLVDRLPEGTPIAGSATEWMQTSLAFLRANYGLGQWWNETGFMGLRFQDTGGATHHAWVELEMSDVLGEVIVKGCAYETGPDKAIIAGDTGLSTGTGLAHPPNAAPALRPGPVTHQVVITGLVGPARIRVVNMAGQTMLNAQAIPAGHGAEATLDVGALPPGAYVVELVQEGHAARLSFIRY